MSPTFVSQIFNSIADTGRELLDLGTGKSRNHSIEGLCRDLLTQKGEASGMALAREVVEVWAGLSEKEQLDFLLFLDSEMSPDQARIDKAVTAYQMDQSPQNYQYLSTAIEAPRQELMRRVNFAPGGTAAIVAMRKNLVGYLKEYPQLKSVDNDLRHLLSSWFNLFRDLFPAACCVFYFDERIYSQEP